MKQFTITVTDDKVDFFVELMECITFVKEVKEEKGFEVPEEHKSIVRERIAKYENSPDSYLVWDEIEERLNNEK
ncbi:MAG TPA: hypothetical protein PLC80_14815 [Draconibacterium sp.]|nr:hypothetical protein [Draconibacterium sp.]